MKSQFTEEIFKIKDEDFLNKSIDFFHHQFDNNHIYKQYIHVINRKNLTPNSIEDFVFLPISFFKTHQVVCKNTPLLNPNSSPLLFESSGTTQQNKSRHYINDSILYEKSFLSSFQSFYGAIEDYCIIALLPSYLEQQHSSLVYMMRDLINKSQHELSGFYLYNFEELYSNLLVLQQNKQKTILMGVTYALLDFAEKFSLSFPELIVMETGGMKGRREEISRDSVHEILKKQFQLKTIHSEYGMTELLSQAYSQGNGIFKCPACMKVLVRDINDPFSINEKGKGAINIIDLANIHSCCFIATDDVGEVYEDGSFKINGRLEFSDLRGCNLMYV